MSVLLRIAALLAMAVVLVGCGGGPEQSTKTDDELMKSTADPSKMVTPADISPDKPGPAATP